MSVLKFRISNSSAAVATFCLEPWGGRYRVPANGLLSVVIEAPTEPIVEWDLGDDIPTLIVQDPAGAEATVYDGENQVRAE
jgi:hypothetical protein